MSLGKLFPLRAARMSLGILFPLRAARMPLGILFLLRAARMSLGLRRTTLSCRTTLSRLHSHFFCSFAHCVSSTFAAQVPCSRFARVAHHSSFSLFFVKMAFVAWLKAVDMTNEGTVKDDALYKEIADIFIANDISCPQDLVGVDALDFKQLIASPGKRAFVKRAVNAAARSSRRRKHRFAHCRLFFILSVIGGLSFRAGHRAIRGAHRVAGRLGVPKEGAFPGALLARFVSPVCLLAISLHRSMSTCRPSSRCAPWLTFRTPCGPQAFCCIAYWFPLLLCAYFGMQVKMWTT